MVVCSCSWVWMPSSTLRRWAVSEMSMRCPSNCITCAPSRCAAASFSSKRTISSGLWISRLRMSDGTDVSCRVNQSILRSSSPPKSTCSIRPMPATRTEKPTSRLTSAASRKAVGLLMKSRTLSVGMRRLANMLRMPAMRSLSSRRIRLSTRSTPPSSFTCSWCQRFCSCSWVEPSPSIGQSSSEPSGIRVAITPTFLVVMMCSRSKWRRSMAMPLRAAVCSMAISCRLAASPLSASGSARCLSHASSPSNSAGRRR